MLRVLHVVYLKPFIWITLDLLISVIAYLINFTQKDWQNNGQIIKCMSSLECTCCLQFWQDSIWISIIIFKIPTLEPKKHKKISVVFDEGLQIICYNQLEDLVEIGKIFICFCKNQICWDDSTTIIRESWDENLSFAFARNTVLQTGKLYKCSLRFKLIRT